MGQENISYIVAFIAGFLSYLSPCLLPLVPSYITYIAGVSFDDLKNAGQKSEIRKKTIIHSLLFISGFSLVFILLGLTATFVGKSLFQYQNAIRVIGGVLITIFGLHLVGILKLDILGKDRRFALPAKGAGYLGSFLVGVTFAAAWTPCAGPILGSILVLAGTKVHIMQGVKLLCAYSLGIAIPFFLTAIAINSFLEYFNRFKKFISYATVVSGVFLIIIGILIMSNQLTIISQRFLSQVF